jgi:hypothetical protein
VSSPTGKGIQCQAPVSRIRAWPAQIPTVVIPESPPFALSCGGATPEVRLAVKRDQRLPGAGRNAGQVPVGKSGYLHVKGCIDNISLPSSPPISLDDWGPFPVESQRDAYDDHDAQNGLLEILIDANDIHPIVQHAHEHRAK